MKKNVKRILIAAGGSGGHIFPAVALAQKLKFMDGSVDIKFIGSRKALDKRIFEKEGFEFFLLSSNTLPYRASPAMIGSIFSFLFDSAKSLGIILAYRPNVVVGFGGYVSFPVMLGALAAGIPRIAHEQNVTPGRANKILFRISDRVAVSFEKTKEFLSVTARGKAVFTGNPIRTEDLKDDRAGALRKSGLDPGKFTILVIGGSQGAHSLNKAFVGAIEMIDKETRPLLQIIHITGVKDYEWVLKAYGSIGITHRVNSFVDRIEEAYSASDLVVTRAGASAVFETAFFGRAMILVPYRFAMSHQVENARAFTEKKAALVIEEDMLTPGFFKDNIIYLLNNRNEVKRLSEAAKAMSVPEASEMLAKETLALANG